MDAVPPPAGSAVPVAPAGLAAPAVEVRGVRRSFGSVHAVVDATFALEPGTVTALVGPNGSGKTTLLLMLAGLLAPDAGEIRIAGMSLASDGARARSVIGWMPDAFGQWDTLTCTEILTTFGAAYRVPPAEASRRAAELLDLVHLAEYAHSPARVLSRGQKQRLGLARALVNHPRVLLLDEPASGLDPRSRLELRGIVRRLAASGAALLISSHVLSELEEMVDGAVFLQRGVTSTAAPAAATARWRLRVLDPAPFLAWAGSVGVAVIPDPDAAPAVAGRSFAIDLPSELQAAALLRDAVAAGVPVTQFAPATGRLEQAYLALEADRR